MQGFTPNKGLKQECCISPTLFKIYVEYALKKWKRKCKEIGIQSESHTLYTLQFADDQILLANDRDDLQYMARKLAEEYAEAGLTINTAKTKYLCIGEKGEDIALDNGQKITVYNEYTYLRVKICEDGKDTHEIRQRINQGRATLKD